MSTPQTGRDRLSASLDKLRKSHHIFLVHSAEYSAFIEELQTLPANASPEELEAAGRRFGGTLVDEKDVKGVLVNAGVRRGRDEVIRALERKLDSYNENLKMVEKQIEVGERALYEAGAEMGEGGAETEGGLPIYEIEEEVDEDGNIINASTKDAQGNVRRIGVKDLPDFEKLVREAERDANAASKKTENNSQKLEKQTKPSTESSEEPLKDLNEAPKPFPAASANPQDQSGGKDTENASSRVLEAVEENLMGSSPKRSPTPLDRDMEAQDLKDDMVSLQNAGPQVAQKTRTKKDLGKGVEEEEIEEIDRSDKKVQLPEGWVTTNPDDTEEDAELRRQMLEYQYHEMGPIVAELNIEEDDDDEEWEDETDEEDEDEDEFGRSTRSFITPQLKAEMAALQARLQAQNLAESIGSSGTPSPSAPDAKSPGDKGKKSVRFNEKLDISPAPSPGSFTKQSPRPPTSPLSPTLKSSLHKTSPKPTPPTPPAATTTTSLPTLDPEEEDTVPFLAALLSQSEEYKSGLIPGLKPPEDLPEEAVPVPKKEKKPSLFKASRSSNTAPAGGVGKKTTVPKVVDTPTTKPVLAAGIVEATPPTKAAGPLAMPPSMSIFKSAEKNTDVEEAPSNRPLLAPEIIEAKPPAAGTVVEEPDELVPEVHRKEAAERLVRLQGKMVAREGGFGKEDEEMGEREFIPLEEEQEGRKKMSKFKMMRMKGMQ